MAFMLRMALILIVIGGVLSPANGAAPATAAPASVALAPATAAPASVALAPADYVEGPVVVRADHWFLRNSFTTGVADEEFVYGNGISAGDIPVFGDWGGFGVKKPGVVRNQVWYIRGSNSTGVADAAFPYGDPGDIPLVGDWDGNGTDTIGVFRAGVWYLKNVLDGSGQADVVFAYGDPGDTPVVGDWNGDGTTTIGVVRPGRSPDPGQIRCVPDPTCIDGWYLRNSNTTGYADRVVSFGYCRSPSTFCVVSDFGGMILESEGLFSAGLWTEYSGPNGPYQFGYGQEGDIPLA